MREEFLSELVEAISNWPEVVAIAEGESQARVSGARSEIGIATMAYNLKRITNVLGATKLREALHHA
ncbi:MAG TPA: hypothetical protein VGM27_06035 [Acidobacteriaceae bacterium]